jgi:hypothetical protein
LSRHFWQNASVRERQNRCPQTIPLGCKNY